VKVLHVVSTTERRGAEIFAADLVARLKADGIIQQVAILRGMSGAGANYEAEVLHPDVLGRLLPMWDPRLISWLASQVRVFTPDVVQAHGGEALKFAVPATRRRAPIVYRKIGLTPTWMAGRGRRAFYGRLMRRAETIIAVGDRVGAEARGTFGVPPSRVIVIPNAVDTSRLSPRADPAATRRALAIPQGARLLLWVGALTDEKDPCAVLELARQIRDRGADAIVVIAGDGPLRARLRETSERLGLSSIVRLLGTSTHIPDLMHASDALVMTSRTEGMPGCLMESGLLGVPSVAYAVGGVPEVVVDGRTGLLAPPGDIGALATQVMRLLADSELSKRLGRAAAATYPARFDIRAVAPRYLALYEDLATRSRAVSQR
jgi:glycosyltransferase involved in cell wall biosynthesis